ncbi:MAG: RdgB/HAM1 family non-canonical purine NTP pyrophosphatase [Solirubrobacterales bacterium]
MILATRNEHKLRELIEILPQVGLHALPPDLELPPEDGDSFAANALIKARAARAACAETAVADDSGIEVEALGGRPGIYSARYAGEGASDEENLEKLLGEVADAGGERRAAYVCVIALVDEGGAERTFEGRCEGRLAMTPRGAGGFGYDPAFVPDDTGPADERTMAQLNPAEKHAISHRGRAARLLAEHLGSAERDGSR